MQYKSSFINLLSEREIFNQCTNLEGLDDKASKGIITGYVGYDATAKSLHIGNLVSIMMLRRLQQAGHKPIVLVGGGTTKVGDPSGKTETRKMLTQDDISSNIASIKRVYEKFLKFGNGPTDAIFVNNADWLDKLNYIEFLRDYGRHFSINRMLTMDSVKLRLEREQPLTFLEFNYMILQAYDFVELNKNYGCVLQMGGSDQWGNIVNGVELARRVNTKDELFGATCPLITKADGSKMGKSVSGAIWLNADMLSSYDYFQFWRNSDDRDVVKFLKIFTDLPMDEIKKLGELKDNEINEAKKILAYEATKLCHGKDAADQALETAKKVFEEGALSDNLPVCNMEKALILAGMPVYEMIFMCGLSDSKGDARRLIKGKGAKINDAVIDDENLLIDSSFLNTWSCF